MKRLPRNVTYPSGIQNIRKKNYFWIKKNIFCIHHCWSFNILFIPEPHLVQRKSRNVIGLFRR